MAGFEAPLATKNLIVVTFIVPPTKLYKLTPYEISSKARQALCLSFFVCTHAVCTHAWLGLAWTADELISYCTSLFSFVGGNSPSPREIQNFSDRLNMFGGSLIWPKLRSKMKKSHYNIVKWHIESNLNFKLTFLYYFWPVQCISINFEILAICIGTREYPSWTMEKLAPEG